MAMLSHAASGLLAAWRKGTGMLLTFLFPTWYGPGKQYRPEEHYMRGPGPKGRAKHLIRGTSAGDT
jgi:hypothetical protein